MKGPYCAVGADGEVPLLTSIAPEFIQELPPLPVKAAYTLNPPSAWLDFHMRPRAPVDE